MLAPPKPLDEIQLILVCELHVLTGMGLFQDMFCPPPPPGPGVKRSNIIFSITKSIFKDFLYQIFFCSHK